MIRPGVGIGQKYKTQSGLVGVIVKLEAYQRQTFLGHTSFEEYLGRDWGLYITIVYETDEGNIRQEVIKT